MTIVDLYFLGFLFVCVGIAYLIKQKMIKLLTEYYNGNDDETKNI